MDDNLVVEKVLNSQAFANKEVLKGLLRFLFEGSKTGASLREADIAVGYFKRGGEFVPGEDTIVRVTIYKLRALLDKYYLEEGRNDTDIIEIPKGSYSVFIKRKGKKPAKPADKRGVLLLAISLIGSLIINGILFFNNPKEKPLDNPFWSSYIKSGQPVYLTLGDPFFFRIKDKSSGTGSLIVRDITINSKEDLDQNKPEELQEIKTGTSELSYPYYSRNNLWPLPNLIAVFAKASVETRLHTLSETNIDDIKNNNVIFIANINSFRWMNKFLEKTALRLYNNPRQIRILRPKDSIVLSVPELVKGSYVDYAILVKLPGPNNNEITMMGDFHASGLKGLSTFITKPQAYRKFSKEIMEKYGSFPEYFEMVVKVTSYNYSDFDTKVIYFNPLAEKN